MKKRVKIYLGMLAAFSITMATQSVSGEEIDIFDDGGNVSISSEEISDKEDGVDSVDNSDSFEDGETEIFSAEDDTPVIDDSEAVSGEISDSLEGYFFYQTYYNSSSYKDEVKITKYAGKDSIVTVPQKIAGKNVTAIGNEAFANNTVITEVYMPSVKTIGNSVFQGASNLQIVKANDAREIGKNVFKKCSSLQNVELNEVSELSKELFKNCKELRTVEAQKAWWVKKGTFYGCENLEQVYAPELCFIEDEAFYNCKNLKHINFPEIHVSIDKYAFKGCSSLEEVYMPQVTMVHEEAFAGCTNLKKFTFNKRCYFMNYAFSNCTSLTKLNLTSVGEIDQMIPSILDGAFSGCTGLTEVSIYQYSICDRAFSGCTNLKKVIFKNNNAYINQYAFFNCPSLKDVYFKDFHETIGNYAFGYAGEYKTPQKVDGISFHCNSGDEANKYAVLNDLNFTFHELNKEVITPATEAEDGKIGDKCGICGEIMPNDTTYEVIPCLATYKLSANKFVYNGMVQKPKIVVKDVLGNTVSPKYYDVVYSGDSIEIGQYTVSLIFKERYSGTKKLTYYITDSQATITAKNVNMVLGSKSKKLNITVTGEYAGLSYKSNNPQIVSVSSDGKITAKKIGSATITITAGATEQYDAVTKKITVKVLPKKTSIVSISKAGNGSLKLIWKSVPKVDGYIIYRSTDKYAIGNKIKTVNGSQNTQYVNSSLKSGKKYYYQIRCYKKVNGKNYYSDYSDSKGATTQSISIIKQFGGAYNLDGNGYGVVLKISQGTDPAYDDIPNGGICARIDVSIRIMGGGVSHSSGYLIKKGGNNYTISGSGLSGGKVKMAKNGLTISGISGGSGKYTLTERYRS